MKNRNLLTCIAAVALFLSACSKEGDNIVNNYGTQTPEPPQRTMLKEYGLIDSSQTIRFAYQNNKVGKIKELISFNTGTAASKYVILYDGLDNPVGYQSYTLPANTLNEQGTYKLDQNKRIVEVLKRMPNGDTIGIGYFQYADLDYQPTSFSYYKQSDKRMTRYDYFMYDNRGNLTRAVSYQDNGTDPLYKSEEVEASGYGKAINSLNQLHNYIVTVGGDYGFSSSSALYFSNYLPTSTRTQTYKPSGNNNSASVSNLNISTDQNNNVTRLSTGGPGSQTIFFKY